jgi:hypothetical protein
MRPEAYLTTAFVTASFSLAIPAYDYQEIGVLVALFHLFNACDGIISPSLTRLRSIYVSNDMRVGRVNIGGGRSRANHRRIPKEVRKLLQNEEDACSQIYMNK